MSKKKLKKQIELLRNKCRALEIENEALKDTIKQLKELGISDWIKKLCYNEVKRFLKTSQ